MIIKYCTVRMPGLKLTKAWCTIEIKNWKFYQSSQIHRFCTQLQLATRKAIKVQRRSKRTLTGDKQDTKSQTQPTESNFQLKLRLNLASPPWPWPMHLLWSQQLPVRFAKHRNLSGKSPWNLSDRLRRSLTRSALSSLGSTLVKTSSN